MICYVHNNNNYKYDNKNWVIGDEGTTENKIHGSRHGHQHIANVNN